MTTNETYNDFPEHFYNAIPDINLNTGYLDDILDIDDCITNNYKEKKNYEIINNLINNRDIDGIIKYLQDGYDYEDIKINDILIKTIFILNDKYHYEEMSKDKILEKVLDNILNPIKYNDENNNKCCSICMNDINKNNWIIKTKCNHLYHKKCIYSWYKTGKTNCPYCRKNQF